MRPTFDGYIMGSESLSVFEAYRQCVMRAISTDSTSFYGYLFTFVSWVDEYETESGEVWNDHHAYGRL